MPATSEHEQVLRALRDVAEGVGEVERLIRAAVASLNPLSIPLDHLLPYLRRTPWAIVSAFNADRYTAEENRQRGQRLAGAIHSTAGIDGQALGFARCLGQVVEPEADSEETDGFRAVAQPALLVPGISFDRAWDLAKRFDEWSFIRDRGDGSVNLYRTETREKETVADLTRFRIIADLRNLTVVSHPGRCLDLVLAADPDPLGVLTSEESSLTDRLSITRNLVLVESERQRKERAWLQIRRVQVGVMAEEAHGSPRTVLHFFGWWREQPRRARLKEGNVVRWAPLFQRPRVAGRSHAEERSDGD